MFDLALSIVFKEVTTSIRSNSARVVSQLVSCFARADPSKTLAKFFPLCALNIRLELESGASATRTTTTHTPIESDTSLHWWTGLLTGALTNAGEAILRHREELVDLLKLMVASCKSERGYTTTGKVLAVCLMSLTSVQIKDYRSANAEEWNSHGQPTFVVLQQGWVADLLE